MKLLASLASPYTRKVRIVLAEKRIDCDIEVVDVNPPDNPVNGIVTFCVRVNPSPAASVLVKEKIPSNWSLPATASLER